MTLPSVSRQSRPSSTHISVQSTPLPTQAATTLDIPIITWKAYFRMGRLVLTIINFMFINRPVIKGQGRGLSEQIRSQKKNHQRVAITYWSYWEKWRICRPTGSTSSAKPENSWVEPTSSNQPLTTTKRISNAVNCSSNNTSGSNRNTRNKSERQPYCYRRTSRKCYSMRGKEPTCWSKKGKWKNRSKI